MIPTTEELRVLRERATKGPLIVDDYSDQTGHATRIAFPDRFGIPSEGVGLAFQNWKDAEDKDQRISWAEAEANAKLWAIAPDLLDEVLRLRADATEAAMQYLSDMGQMTEKVTAMRDALEAMLHSVCGPTGLAEAIRNDTGYAYPWPSLDTAEQLARAALEEKP